MELLIGPFEVAAHIRARDHYQAIRREAALAGLDPSSPPRRYEELVGRLYRLLGLSTANEAVDRAFRAGASAFTATVSVPDESVAAGLRMCDELNASLDELNAWTGDGNNELLATPQDIRDYQRAFMAQLRAQLQAARPAS
jgi:hypothetical protein